MTQMMAIHNKYRCLMEVNDSFRGVSNGLATPFVDPRGLQKDCFFLGSDEKRCAYHRRNNIFKYNALFVRELCF